MTATRTLASPELGEVTALRFASDVLTVAATTPRPPGTRVAVALAGSPGIAGAGKVVSVRRPDPRLARWEADVKLFAPSKALRAHLAAAVSEDASSAPEC